MTDVTQSPQQNMPAGCASPPVVKVTNRDIEDYTECMLRALERLARTNGHEMLAKLLHLACAEAKYLKMRHDPGA